MGYKCAECNKSLKELEAIYLHKRIGLLVPDYYYCKKCIESEGAKNVTT